MNTGRGTFVVVEGTDGSGKGTQFKLLVDRLRQEGYDVETFDFPQYDRPSSHFVREYLNGNYGGLADVGPYTASLFYALDRFEAAHQIRQALDDGKVVLANRYVGSSMAHQGTKFSHAEERRGYFIWLDNLEFEMLRIPRPDFSFVLRVPAEIAQRLVDQKQERSYTTKKRDLHEADLGHLQKAAEVYDDMCQLFPKDFVRVDCTRGDGIMDIASIHEILWQRLEPVLPPKRPKRKSEAQDDAPPDEASSSHLVSNHLVVQGASLLLTKILGHGRMATYVERASRFTAYDQKNAAGEYRYFTPKQFDEKLTEQYRAYMDQIFNLYGEMVGILTSHLKSSNKPPTAVDAAEWEAALRQEAREVLRPVLPAAATTDVSIYGSGSALESVIANLASDTLHEARQCGTVLLNEARKILPSLLGAGQLAETVTYRSNSTRQLASIVKKYLSDNYADTTHPVRLTDVWPRNEMDLVPDMLYSHSDVPLSVLQQAASSWPYDRKIEVFEAYIGERQNHSQRPGRALEKAHYSWDLISDFDTFRDLQRHRVVDDLEWQILTPRYGYDIPRAVEDAGLLDQFEACFELSLRLHGLIQEAGFAAEAQYATLLGHRIRWKMTYNAREAFHLLELRSSPHNRREVRELVQTMYDKLCQVHPLLGEAMKFAGKD
ncbi:MAG TPA: FAD-dependent thymidylate synthase [Candidatus Saccharimonadales bacterium]|nr:FAD-dependent thymidylate synthase [Candidatus Saccharimonadales bacterium]